MSYTIRLVRKDETDKVVAFGLRAWEQVFVSWRGIFGDALYEALYPDWKKVQGDVIIKACQEPETFSTWVADVDGEPVGFIAAKLDEEKREGEVYLLAVDPDHRNQGIGLALNQTALAWFRESGMITAHVGTGGDPSHAAARTCYEKAGYTGLPLVRYYQKL